MYIWSDGFGSGDGVGGQSERTNLRNPPVTHFIQKCTSHFGIDLVAITGFVWFERCYLAQNRRITASLLLPSRAATI